MSQEKYTTYDELQSKLEFSRNSKTEESESEVWLTDSTTLVYSPRSSPCHLPPKASTAAHKCRNNTPPFTQYNLIWKTVYSPFGYQAPVFCFRSLKPDMGSGTCKWPLEQTQETFMTLTNLWTIKPANKNHMLPGTQLFFNKKYFHLYVTQFYNL